MLITRKPACYPPLISLYSINFPYLGLRTSPFAPLELDIQNLFWQRPCFHFIHTSIKIIPELSYSLCRARSHLLCVLLSFLSAEPELFHRHPSPNLNSFGFNHPFVRSHLPLAVSVFRHTCLLVLLPIPPLRFPFFSYVIHRHRSFNLSSPISN